MIRLDDKEGSVLFNLTETHITLLSKQGEPIEIAPEYPEPLFVRPEHENVSRYFAKTRWYPVGPTPLPERIDGVYYIVNKAVKMAFPGREDFVIPANIIRNGEMYHVVCRRFTS